MAEATPVNFRDPGKARNCGGGGGAHPFLEAREDVQNSCIGVPLSCLGLFCFQPSSRERGLLRAPSHFPATTIPHSTQPTAGLLLLLDTGIHPGSVAPAFGAAGTASPAWAPRAHGAAKAGGHTAGAALAPPPVCAIGAVRRAGAGGLEKPGPALPRIGTPPRRLLGVTPPVPLPAIFGDGQWEGGGAATPVCPRRGVAHGTRVQSSAGRVRAQARLRPPGRAAPSGDPRSPSRVPPGGPAVPAPLPKVTARPPQCRSPSQGHGGARGSPGGGPRAGLRPPPQLAQFAALHRLLRGTCGGCGASGGQRGPDGAPAAPGPAPPGTCAALRGELAGAARQRVHGAGPGPRPRRPRPSAERAPRRGL